MPPLSCLSRPCGVTSAVQGCIFDATPPIRAPASACSCYESSRVAPSRDGAPPEALQPRNCPHAPRPIDPRRRPRPLLSRCLNTAHQNCGAQSDPFPAVVLYRQVIAREPSAALPACAGGPPPRPRARASGDAIPHPDARSRLPTPRLGAGTSICVIRPVCRGPSGCCGSASRVQGAVERPCRTLRC